MAFAVGEVKEAVGRPAKTCPSRVTSQRRTCEVGDGTVGGETAPEHAGAEDLKFVGTKARCRRRASVASSGTAPAAARRRERNPLDRARADGVARRE